MIGKHIVSYVDEARRACSRACTAFPAPSVRVVEKTMILDSRRAKDMMSPQAVAANVVASPPPAQPTNAPDNSTSWTARPTIRTTRLSGKLTVIGKSDMASIKLKGWFAPKVAAVINKRDGKYFIAASKKT